MPDSVTIVPALPAHAEGVWRIFHEVVRAGDAFVFPADISREDALAWWFAPGNKVYVALDSSGRVGGSYILKPNHPGRGAHVANGSYMTSPHARGTGLGNAMAEHSVSQAAALGFRALQFNMVVSTNETAVRLWLRHGFRIVGTVPQAFHHATLGYVDAHIMHRSVGPPDTVSTPATGPGTLPASGTGSGS
jgi:L-amino acid N-acyltransferase YncA